MNPTFWNERFADGAYAYGERPNTFLAAQEERLAEPSEVVELGGGEGRNAVWYAEQGHHVTMVDYAREGLAKARRLAEARGVSIETIEADLTRWDTDRTWDVVLISFLHLEEDARPALYERVRRIVRPGGYVFAEWFRPEQVTKGYESGGPKTTDRLAPVDELRAHFGDDGLRMLEPAEVDLDEGPYHRGKAAVVRLVWQRPS